MGLTIFQLLTLTPNHSVNGSRAAVNNVPLSTRGHDKLINQFSG
jgi:hypothetical protein